MSLEPRLPPELELRIFTLCVNNDKHIISILLLVCHRVKDWIEPLLFRTIIFESKVHEAFDSILSMTTAKSPEFLAQHVRFCAIESQEHWDDEKVKKATLFFELCSEIRDLALWSHFPRNELPFNLGCLRNLRRLSLNWRTVVPIAKFLSSEKLDVLPITHLLWEMDQIDRLLPLLPKLPHLTHIQFTWWESDDHSSAPGWMKSLVQVTAISTFELVIIHFPSGKWGRLGVEDERGLLVKYPELDHNKVVLLHQNPESDFYLSVEWESRLYGEDDLWSRAQRVLDKRLASDV